jgi:hypothetical protein
MSVLLTMCFDLCISSYERNKLQYYILSVLRWVFLIFGSEISPRLYCAISYPFLVLLPTKKVVSGFHSSCNLQPC